MLKLNIATVFSGIGSPEQALLRLGIDINITFACDNGNRIIDIDYSEEFNKVKSLHTIEKKRKYVDELYRCNSRQTNFVKKSYLANYEEYLCDDNFFEDVKLLDGTDFKNKVDIFVGGSPCQSFSGIGNRGGLEDTRGTLFYEFARLVQEISPKVFVYENVYGLLTHDKGRTWEIMQNVFGELGYDYSWAVLDSRDYGIPQGRRRVFVVGFKSKGAAKRFHFPNPVPLEYTMQDFLEENCAVGSLQSIDSKLVKINNDKGAPDEVFYLTPKLLKYCLSPGTKNFMHKDAKIDLPIARAILSTIANHHRSSINNYVTTSGRVRTLTPREATRLMGFPDSYKMTLSNAQSYKQAGNSIVVDVMIAIFKEILYSLKW